MINSICFSKDRAAQLDLLIRSVDKNAKDVFALKVIYTYSDEEFEKGYNQLIEKYPEIEWIKESSFREDVINSIQNTENEYTCFFTDDDIIYKPFTEEEITIKLKEDANSFCFSTRLGKNTDKCYAMKCDNVIIPDYEDEKYISWDWHVHYADFGYPLSVDGHIFRTSEILKLTRKVNFNNPNTYEASLQMFDNYPKKKMWSFIHSALVNTPANVVQSVFPNRKGETFGISVNELNEAFLSGRVIDFDSMDFQNIYGCHQELNLPLIEI